MKSRANEVVVFAFITYRSRKDRDRIMAKVMKDERLSSMIDMNDMPFDGMRMFWGGFKIIVQP